MTANTTQKLITSTVEPVSVKDGRIILLDQRQLPDKVENFDATALEDMCFAISEMVVRGAPAIGVAAALGLAAEAKRLSISTSSREEFLTVLNASKLKLQATRPTAINLNWATNKIYDLALNHSDQSIAVIAADLLENAQAMIAEDIRINRAIGEHGADLIGSPASILTHCNAGALATCGWGTALGVVRSAYQRNQSLIVYADETRPRQQGARLTAWELLRDNIPTILVPDTAAGYLISQGKIDLIIVGADRIATNGDTANKIGTYTLAVLAQAHNIPFYVAAPISTIDGSLKTGAEIPIEERNRLEVTNINGKPICPEGVGVVNPAFDVTPGRLITAIITEAGVLREPYTGSIPEALKK